jgi:hypothetical protein
VALARLTYGPFRPNADGYFLPEPDRLTRDFQHVRSLGANALRVYHVPAPGVLDAARAAGLRLFVDVPWQKHRCFFEDWEAQREARRLVRAAARTAGRHPACFAVSVANEVPHDIVRFYGHRRVAGFLDDLLAAAKDEAPDCLATYCNYPSTEFLTPGGVDFYCANVYLSDVGAFGRYVDRLHHVAGPLPVVIGEHGTDAVRNGEDRQADELAGQLRTARRRGVAGTFAFAYTDDWFTGGAAVEDWGFGITGRDRQEKPAAAAVRAPWADADARADAGPRAAGDALPRVSVVVCSYNGAATLDECLRSRPRSTTRLRGDPGRRRVHGRHEFDRPQPPGRAVPLAAERGLERRPERGLAAAAGAVVAYTDSDCVADPDWLRHLMTAMRDQGVEAVGGPNVPPGSDALVAKCVAASPGGPSHVMLDDRLAEHVPGCNMAFARDRLLALGGFDEQFRQAGDDVDVCWRFLDAGLRIGFAPAALVWHHRRSTVRAYLRQQAGYGRSEAMVLAKHPQRAAALGGTRWGGVIYGDGAVGLPVAP